MFGGARLHTNRGNYSVSQGSLECSVFVDPIDPGLSYEEILEVWEDPEPPAGLKSATK